MAQVFPTLYEGNNCHVSLVVSPKGKFGKEAVDVDGSLVILRTSPNGRENLFFDPRISMKIRNKANWNSPITIPSDQIEQVADDMADAYEGLLDQKLFTKNGETLCLNPERLKKHTKHMSLREGDLTIRPGLVQIGNAGQLERGIIFAINNIDRLGIDHSEARGLIGRISHIDLDNISISCGIMDELATIIAQNNRIIDQNNRLLNMRAPAGAVQSPVTLNMPSSLGTWRHVPSNNFT